jgi:hypothetical protein
MIDLPADSPQQNVVTYAMISQVAKVTKTPVLALYLIYKQEAGTIGKCNATRDCGPFQVNRQHYKELSEFGLSESDIINTAWGSAYAAGIILRKKLNVCNQRNYDWLGKISCYHSFTPKFRLIYRGHLERHANDLKKLVKIKAVNTNE